MKQLILHKGRAGKFCQDTVIIRILILKNEYWYGSPRQGERKDKEVRHIKRQKTTKEHTTRGSDRNRDNC